MQNDGYLNVNTAVPYRTSADRYFSECMISPLKDSCPLKHGRLAQVLVPVQMHTPSKSPSSSIGSCEKARNKRCLIHKHEGGGGGK